MLALCSAGDAVDCCLRVLAPVCRGVLSAAYGGLRGEDRLRSGRRQGCSLRSHFRCAKAPPSALRVRSYGPRAQLEEVASALLVNVECGFWCLARRAAQDLGDLLVQARKRHDRTRTRRDHVKYLTLIRTIALLHQYQREVKTVLHGGVAVPYIEVTTGDIALANRLAHQVLGRSLDELSPQTRRVLMALDQMVEGACTEQELERQEYRFSRKDVRVKMGLSDFQARTHLDKLVSLEYVLVHRGGRGQSFVYELLYDGQGKDGQPFLSGLLDVEKLQERGYDGKNEHRNDHFEGGSSEDRGVKEPLPSPGRGPLSPAPGAADSSLAAKVGENAHLDASFLPSRRSVGGNGSLTQPGY
jgi:hypothetical protein